MELGSLLALRQQEEAQRERLRVEEQARRVAAEEAERLRQQEEALRVAAEERVLAERKRKQEEAQREAARKPMKISDSRFEKGRCHRGICCDEC